MNDRNLILQILKDRINQFAQFKANREGLIKDFFNKENIDQPFKFKVDGGYGFCKTIDQGKINGISVINFENGEFFIGQMLRNRKTGKGYKLYNDGTFYEGTYEKDKKK